MAQVILFGGGDAGGLIIGPNGVRPIPPFDPGLLAALRGVAGLVRAHALSSDKRARRDLASVVSKAANVVVEGVEAVVGPLAGDQALIYQDDDGGFTCGSTGKPPIPLPWPPATSPALPDLVSSGLLERELSSLLAADKSLKLQDVIKDPEAAAKKAGVTLSRRALDQLSLISPAHVKEIRDPVGREVVEFFHKVAADGRYIETWSQRPYEAAQSLKVKLSDAALDRIVAGGAALGIGGGETSMSPVVIGIVVVVIMLVPTEAGRVPINIVDRSFEAKF